MKVKISIMLLFAFMFCLTGCEKRILSEYNVKGIYFIAYSDIDSVCETDDLITAGESLLSSQADNLLLSYVMDSAIELTDDELGEYDHLLITNPRWIGRFGAADKLKPVDYNSLTDKMQIFLQDQMPLLTVDGSVLPKGTGLYRYEGDKLLAFPVNVTLGVAEPIEAKNPLIILVENPVDVFKASSFMLPLTSSGNVLFDDGDKLQEEFENSKLKDYGEIQAFGQ